MVSVLLLGFEDRFEFTGFHVHFVAGSPFLECKAEFRQSLTLSGIGMCAANQRSICNITLISIMFLLAQASYHACIDSEFPKLTWEIEVSKDIRVVFLLNACSRRLIYALS